MTKQAIDVWATGITLYTMLTGHTPFWAETVPEIYAHIQVSCAHHPVHEHCCSSLSLLSHRALFFFTQPFPAPC